MDTRELAWTSIAGTAYAIPAYIVFEAIGYMASPSTRALAVGATAGAAVIGAVSWWALVVERPDPDPRLMGMFGGGTVGLVAHLPAWIAYGIATPSQPLMLSLAMAAYSASLFGWWLTGPLAAAIGLCVGSARWLADGRRGENQDE